MSFFKELKRRNVFRVTAAYVVVGWLLLQIGDVVFEALELDASANRMLMAFVLLGLIPTIIFSWAFEITPEGIKKDKDVVRDAHQEQQTAKKLDYITMAVLVLVGGMSLYQHWDNDEKATEPQVPAQDTVEENQTALKQIDDKSLAILPFINIAQTDDNEPFTVGIHDDLITHLSKISALKVISRTSVLKYKDSDKQVREIARDLGVAHVLEGGVQRAGNQIRLNVQLVDAQTEEHLWAETFNRELSASNIFMIQSEISEKIAAALQAQLTDAELVSLGKQQTDNLDAYNAYLAGRQRLLVRNSVAIKEALTLFKKATDLDPNYALAYVGQADSWSLLNEYSNISEDEMFEKGEPLLEKALSLDPMLAEAHTSKANYLLEKNQFEAAGNRFEYALKLNPNYATTYHWYGNLADRLGEKAKALELYRKAAQLDPLSPVIQTNIGFMLSEADKHEEALQQFDRIMELVPEYSGGANGKSIVYSNMGVLDEAVKWQKESIAQDPGNLGRRANLALLYIDLGLIEQAQNEISLIRQQTPEYEGLLYAEATLDLYQGNYQQAAARFEEKLLKQPNDLSYLGNWTFYQMLLGNYEAAISASLSMFPGKNGQEYEVNFDNFDTTVNLIWMWQQTGEQQKADDLLRQLKNYLAEYSNQNTLLKQSLILAVEGKYTESAQMFSELFATGEVRGLWRGDHLPMLKEVIRLSETQDFIKKHELELERQRQAVLAIAQA
ncbi:tetratricopeptide repeat protein [Marinicella sp. W31]|uniref:tetratricopeptide repeat protein n=1 Tax=Marinicella sp. W31 TaxID=3023713 RepID=UPI0037570708